MPKVTPAYYLSYKDRVSLSEYWLYYQLPALVFFVITTALFQLEYPHFWAVFTSAGEIDMQEVMQPTNNPILTWLGVIVEVVEIPIGIVLMLGSIRRLHDRGRSGWFMLISLIPLIGPIWLMIELALLKGTPGPNRFGI